MTHLEQPDLVEVAVGVETSSRRQIVWQVRVHADDARGAGCGSADKDVPGWAKRIAPSTGRLTTDTFDVPPESDPCELPPTGGYRGLENQTYRVEIQDPGQPGGNATFKWSRENGSVGSRVASMISANELELPTLGRDEVLRVNTGDWVEITDDVRELSVEITGDGEFSRRGGELRRITVNEAARRITFSPALPAEMLPGAFPDADFPQFRNLRVRRWDQKGKVLEALADTGTTSVFQDLDDPGETGAIRVPAAGTTVLLDNAVTVTFDADPIDKGDLKAGDYWVFAARTADASVEKLSKAPARGIHHHYARLGIWDVATGIVTDCRTIWPPRGEGDDCGCTSCVTAESHAATGTASFTIQMAVDEVMKKGGGTVCLGPGVYDIDTMVHISGAKTSAIKIVGHGLPILKASPGFSDQAVMLIEQSVNISVEDLSVAGGLTTDASLTVAGLLIRDSFFVRVHRCVFGNDDPPREATDGRSLQPAIAFAGAVVDTDILWNVFKNVEIGIGDDPHDDSHLVARLSIESNRMVCHQAGVMLKKNDEKRAFEEIRFSRNSVRSPIGFQINGFGLGVSVDANTFELTLVDSSVVATEVLVGVRCAISHTSVSDNYIFGSDSNNSIGIALDGPMHGTQITGNLIDGLAGAGIVAGLNARLTKTIIARNRLLNLAGGGIVMPILDSPISLATDLDIVGNLVDDVARDVDTDSPPDSPLMSGIRITHATNVNVTGNAISNVGRTAKATASRYGILVFLVSGTRVSGNRVVDIGPATAAGSSAGVAMFSQRAHSDVVDNEVRRSTLSETKGNVDRSLWSALQVFGEEDNARADVSVRGNLLQSFGSSETVRITTEGSCIFSENQCICDNADGVFGDFMVNLNGAAVIASANCITRPHGTSKDGPKGLRVSTFNPDRAHYSVVGNIVAGTISANGQIAIRQAPVPLDALNAVIL